MFALRQGSLRVGSEPIRIHRGIRGAENGTPMLRKSSAEADAFLRVTVVQQYEGYD